MHGSQIDYRARAGYADRLILPPMRTRCAKKMTQSDLDNIKHEIPHQSPLQPVELDADSEIQFDCHKGISCFNACCRNIDITLMPYDILRLKRRVGLTSSQWVANFTVPYPMDAHEMPGLKMATKAGSSECVFLREEGCSVYEDRPSACRYYALGSMGVRRVASAKVDDIYFLVKEPHCKGHDEPKRLTVGQYRNSQGLEKYDEMNREWRDIVLKKRSAGPTIGKPSARSMQLFDMCSYDMDNFRDFIATDGFSQVFALDADEQTALMKDEDKLLLFACRFLKQVLFGEMTIAVKADGCRARLEKRRRASATSEQENADKE